MPRGTPTRLSRGPSLEAFDALGHDPQAQAAAEVDRRAHDRGVLFILKAGGDVDDDRDEVVAVG